MLANGEADATPLRLRATVTTPFRRPKQDPAKIQQTASLQHRQRTLGGASKHGQPVSPATLVTPPEAASAKGGSSEESSPASGVANVIAPSPSDSDDSDSDDSYRHTDGEGGGYDSGGGYDDHTCPGGGFFNYVDQRQPDSGPDEKPASDASSANPTLTGVQKRLRGPSSEIGGDTRAPCPKTSRHGPR